MKRLWLIGGTMGVGKTTVCRELKHRLDRCVFLDGDWCWDADPFQVTEETKAMVLRNITALLGEFLRCSAYENVVFCWVMHQQEIIDTILSSLDLTGVEVYPISLLASSAALTERLLKDVENGIREHEVIARSTARIPLYEALDTIKIRTDGKTVGEIAEEIERIGS